MNLAKKNINNPSTYTRHCSLLVRKLLTKVQTQPRRSATTPSPGPHSREMLRYKEKEKPSPGVFDTRGSLSDSPTIEQDLTPAALKAVHPSADAKPAAKGATNSPSFDAQHAHGNRRRVAEESYGGLFEAAQCAKSYVLLQATRPPSQVLALGFGGQKGVVAGMGRHVSPVSLQGFLSTE